MNFAEKLTKAGIEPAFEARNLIQIFKRSGSDLMVISPGDYEITDVFLYPLSPESNEIVPVVEHYDKTSTKRTAAYYDYGKKIWAEYELHDNKQSATERPRPKKKKEKAK